MTIQTSKGRQFTAEWFGATLNQMEVFGEIVPLSNTMRLSEIASDFEDLDYITRHDESQGDKIFNVKPELRSISRTDRNTIKLGFWGK